MDIQSVMNVSIIIPTFREAKNIDALIARIDQVNFGTRLFEVIIVDDNSNDGIVSRVQELMQLYPWLSIHVRLGKRSLSQSVIDGFQRANYPILISMDADLSHPPEKIPLMLNALSDPDTDFVIGSRYIDGGSTDESWPIYRKLASLGAAFIANLLIFSHRKIKDPLSGFCALRKSLFNNSKTLNAIGWKIGLEMMVKFRCKKIIEIPIHFAERHQGESKLSCRVIWQYLQQINQLFWYKILGRAVN